ncbi:hypothetical protein DRO32_03085, partial [Candidatus Bathyarchaeota archaeon]
MVSGREERTLILCVDRDDDVGTKTGVRTPVIGREANLRTATQLALSDPEEADANAMFEAVRLYERLSSSGQGSYEIATITGSPLGGVKADRKLLEELDQVLKAFPADGVILVTDGYADETVIPLIQSRVPIVSISRVVVRHSKSIEETAALFSRYARLILENPRYSKWVLGLPGTLLMVFIIVWILDAVGLPGALRYAWAGFGLAVALAMCIKGFGVGRRLLGAVRAVKTRVFKFPSPHTYIIITSYIAGITVVLLGVYHVLWFVRTAPATVVQPILADPAMLVGWVFTNVSHIFITGFCILILGRCIHWFSKRDPRGWYGLVGLLVCAWSYRLIYEVGRMLINPIVAYTGLMTTVLLGILLTSLAALLANVLKLRYE